MKSFGRYIKEIRIEKDLGLREAARLIGITHTRLNCLETGLNTHNKKTKPSLDNIVKIAMAYDLSIIELIKISRIKEYEILFKQLFILKQDEQELLNAYRDLGRHTKKELLDLIKLKANHN